MDDAERNHSKRAVVVGASSGVGRALATRLAEAGYNLVLASRDARDLAACSADLRLRFKVECHHLPVDLGAADWNALQFAQSCKAHLGAVDVLAIPAGGAIDGDENANESVIDGVHQINFVGPAQLAAAFGRDMATAGSGLIVLFSSIAAAAARRKNPAYSAAKAALETYSTGLRHALTPSGVEVAVVALGYVDTAQTFGMRLLFPVSSPDAVARHVMRRILARAGGKAYYPRFWFWVTLVLRCLPWAIYRRLRF